MLKWLQGLDSSRSRSRDSGSVPSTNEEWLDALEQPDRDPTAIEALRKILVRGLRAALQKRVPRQAETLAEDFAQEALLKILDKVHTFRGESKFTTWAQKIAVRTAFTELRRKRWENVSLDDMLADAGDGGAPPDAAAASETSADPEESTSQEFMMQRVQRIIQTTLTDRQRTAITAVMQDMPLEEVARRMDTNRNALYKVIHDARTKVKAELEEQGLSAEQLLDELD